MSNKKTRRRRRGFRFSLRRMNRNIAMAGAAMLALLIAVVGVGGSLLGGGTGRDLIVEPPSSAAAEAPVKEEARETATAVLSASVNNDDFEELVVVGDNDEEGPLQPVQPLQPVAASEDTVTVAEPQSGVPLQPVVPQQPAEVAQQPAAAPAGLATGTPAVSTLLASSNVTGWANIPSYQQINPDVKGWLKIPGTNIDYPVLYNAYDVNYYLEKDIYKQYSRNGVIWADPYCTFGNSSSISRNTVLYGHNWTNYSATPSIGRSSDVMFAQLTGYHYLDFAQSHPYIYYSTADQEMTWVVFACFYTDLDFIYNYVNPDEAGLAGIISGAKARSRFNINVDVNSSDKILTLSTCTRAYGKSDKQRFVVMARLLRPGESAGGITMTSNPNPIIPTHLWY